MHPFDLQRLVYVPLWKDLKLFENILPTARQQIKPEMHDLLQNKLKPKVAIGLVSGSDLVKVSEQMGKDCINEFDFVFPENGLVAYENGVEIGRQSIAKFMGEEKLQKFINFCLGYMSKLELPVKRGTFIEFRNGLINICPPGRSVSLNLFSETFSLSFIFTMLLQ